MTNSAPQCDHACAAHEGVRDWVRAVANGSDDSLHTAWLAITATNPLPAVLGRICYATCEAACNRARFDAAVSIQALEAAIGDHAIERDWQFTKPPTLSGHHVMVIGSGPCGLSSAYHLAKDGHQVLLVEAQPKTGGMLRRGITENRLPKTVLDSEIDRILNLGVQLETRRVIRRIHDALDEFDGVIWAAGASMCMAIVAGRTLWKQPAHTDNKVRRTATVSIGRGMRAASALSAYFAGVELPAPHATRLFNPDTLITGFYPRLRPQLPYSAIGQPLDLAAAVTAEATRCLSCGSCLGCGTCLDLCAHDAVLQVPGPRFEIDQQRCVDCGICATQCPSGAIQIPEASTATPRPGPETQGQHPRGENR